MKQDGKLVEHDCEFDKVLGYKYSPTRNIISISHVNLDNQANSKRKILSESSKVFDPLGLASPVTVRGKTLISSLWDKKSSENHWDEVVAGEDQSYWIKLCQDLINLDTLEFPRHTLSEDEPADLFVFCDASKEAYGYNVYMYQGGSANLIFAKSKVAPLKRKSLPTLELLSVYLSHKGLFSLLKTFRKVKIRKIVIAVDAQVVLAWLLSDDVKTKNQFAKNRIMDIHKMKK